MCFLTHMFIFQGEESSDVQTVFAVCLQAEQVPATVQDYREKLLHLRKLRHDLVQPCLPKGPFHEVANAFYSISSVELFLKTVVTNVCVFIGSSSISYCNAVYQFPTSLGCSY